MAVNVMVKTLLITDLVDSTGLFTRLGDTQASAVLAYHDRLARDLLADFGGREIDKSDGFLMLFERPIDAVNFALAYHEGLARISEDLDLELQARSGIHLGEVIQRENDPDDVARGAKALEIEGLAKPAAARAMQLAGSRQILMTQGAFDLARRATVGEESPDRDLRWLAHGLYQFKGVDEPLEIFEIGEQGFAPLMPPMDSEKAWRAEASGDQVALGWRPAHGQEIPRRPGWLLKKKLGEGGFGDVWLAEHEKSTEKRVFKFCYELDRLRSLQREVTVFRLLREHLGNRDDIARILDWNFQEPPYSLESDYTEGGNLLEWAEAEGGIAEVSLAVRLELAAQVADALAAAHSVGVLHKDIKPGNILITRDRDGSPKAVITDFGIGRVTDLGKLAARGITAVGLTEMMATGTSTGTQLYMAPELLEGKAATIQADVYALGVVLYQLVVGDLRHALAPGWDRDVEDEVLREDIAVFVDGEPNRRPRSASEVADRLRQLGARRAARQTERRARAEAVKARRRRRLLVSFSAVTSVVLMVVSALAVYTWNARREALVSRGQAERLISFMLDDLKQKLDPLGRLDILNDVGDEALAYFDAVPEKDLTPREIFNRHTALKQIGQVRRKHGDLSGAMEVFEESLGLMRSLVELEPDNAEWLKALGTSYSWVGSIFWDQGDIEGTLYNLRAQLEIAKRLAARDPARLDWQAEVAKGHINIGSILKRQRNLEDALMELRLAQEIAEDLSAREPTETKWLDLMSKVHSAVGAVMIPLGDLRGALERYEADLEIRKNLADDDPSNRKMQSDLAAKHNLTGQLRESLGDVDTALKHQNTAVDILHQLVANDPTNTRWKRNLEVSRLRVGNILLDQGKKETATDIFRQAEREIEELVAAQPEKFLWQRDLGTALLATARALHGSGDSRQALTKAKAAVDQLATAAQKHPDDRELSRWLSHSYILLGRIQEESGDSQSAADSWGRALAAIEPLALASRKDPLLLDPWAQVLLLQGRLREAKALVEELRTMGYKDRRFVDACARRKLN